LRNSFSKKDTRKKGFEKIFELYDLKNLSLLSIEVYGCFSQKIASRDLFLSAKFNLK
jgi:hypothetical protein